VIATKNFNQQISRALMKRFSHVRMQARRIRCTGSSHVCSNQLVTSRLINAYRRSAIGSENWQEDARLPAPEVTIARPDGRLFSRSTSHV
jgi:hypothetical protein